MSYLTNPDQTTVLDKLKSGQTLNFYKHDSRHGFVEVRMYVINDSEIVVSLSAQENASELESQFYSFDDWANLWQFWGLEAVFQADEYTLM